MKFCSKCGKEIVDEAIVCPNCGCAVAYGGAKSVVNIGEDSVNVGLCVLAALFPIFGFIYWPLKYKEAPRKAKACGITAIVSFAINFIVILASMM